MSEPLAAQRTLPEFPFSSGPMTLPAEYAERRASCPMDKVRLPSGHEAVLLVRYRDVAAAWGDSRLSRDLTAPGMPRATAGPSYLDHQAAMINTEGERHRRLRRIVAAAFTPRSAWRWTPDIEQIGEDLIRDLEQTGPQADIMAAFCLPLPGRVMARLLGIPQQDVPRFSEWSTAFLSASEMPADRQLQVAGEFAQYVMELLAQRRETPGDGLIDDLIAARDGDERLSEIELVGLTLTLISAGNETTSNSLARYLITLLDGDRSLWEQLVADPELIPAAVDELLRHTILGPNVFVRLATEDIELPSGTVESGEAVLLATWSAQRDNTVFPDAETLHWDRDNNSASLAFGVGHHTCLGMHLAKQELEIGLRLLAQRLPGLRLAVPANTIAFTNGEVLSSPISLPVSW